MFDRIPTPGKENRVRITQDNGQVVEGVLFYADDAVQEGTAFNKQNVLKDDTCHFLGLDCTAVPDDATRFAGSVTDGACADKYRMCFDAKKPLLCAAQAFAAPNANCFDADMGVYFTGKNNQLKMIDMHNGEERASVSISTFSGATENSLLGIDTIRKLLYCRSYASGPKYMLSVYSYGDGQIVPKNQSDVYAITLSYTRINQRHGYATFYGVRNNGATSAYHYFVWYCAETDTFGMFQKSLTETTTEMANTCPQGVFSVVYGSGSAKLTVYSLDGNTVKKSASVSVSSSSTSVIDFAQSGVIWKAQSYIIKYDYADLSEMGRASSSDNGTAYTDSKGVIGEDHFFDGRYIFDLLTMTRQFDLCEYSFRRDKMASPTPHVLYGYVVERETQVVEIPRAYRPTKPLQNWWTDGKLFRFWTILFVDNDNLIAQVKLGNVSPYLVMAKEGY